MARRNLTSPRACGRERRVSAVAGVLTKGVSRAPAWVFCEIAFAGPISHPWTEVLRLQVAERGVA